MRLQTPARLALTSAVALALASCETPAPAPPPPPPPPPPAPVVAPPPPPPISLNTQIIELASTYRATMASAAGISPAFMSGDEVEAAVRTSASYELAQLQQGAVAYAAIAALQEPNFVASVRRYAVDKTIREDVAARLIANPAYATTFENHEAAAGLAIAALDGTGAQVASTGYAVKQAAYDVQHSAWSKQNIPNAADRLSLAKDLSAQRNLAGEADVESLRQATVGAAALSLAGDPVSGPYTPVITRALAVAALAALGMAGDDRAEAVAPLLDEQSASYCLNLAKLNYYQCLAVSKPYYEDVFCLGQHALIDTGECMIKAAGAPVSAFTPPPPPAPAPAPAPKSRSRR